MLIIYIKLLVQTILLLVQKDFENTVYKNYNNSQISRCKYYMSSKIWDIAWVSKFKTRSKIRTLLIKK